MKQKYAEQDVAAVLAIEAPAKALLEAIEAATPAIDRLHEARYAGIEDLETQLGVVKSGNGDAIGELIEVVRALGAAKGNSGAFDYLYFVKHWGCTVGERAREILEMADDDAHMRRVEALRAFAATATA